MVKHIQEEIDKFNDDVKNIPRWLRIAISFDQFVGCFIWNKSQDETISSYIGRKIRRNKANWAEKILCWFLGKLQNNHCIKSLGE